MGLLLLSGDPTAPRVREFTWENKQIGAEDTGFILTFFRPMNHSSVEENLKARTPPPRKFSWAGRRMAYTLKDPAPYGVTYTVKLAGATDKYSEKTTKIKERQFNRLAVPFAAAIELLLTSVFKAKQKAD